MNVRLIPLVLGALLLAGGPLMADTVFEPFTQERFQQARDEGGPVLVEVWAEWCSTCARQSPILESLLQDEEFSDYTALRMDWDAQEHQARALGAPRQSTLLVYRDGERRVMSVAETSENGLRDVLRAGL